MGMDKLNEFLYNRKYGFRCPQCGKNWVDGEFQCTCGQELSALGCPSCLEGFATAKLWEIHKLMYEGHFLCDKCVPLTISAREFHEKYNEFLDDNTAFHEKDRLLSSKISLTYYSFWHSKATFEMERCVYFNLPDKSQVPSHMLEHIRAFAAPHKESSQTYFLKNFDNHTYDELDERTSDDEHLAELMKELTFRKERAFERKALYDNTTTHTPKCPICGSPNLTKISTMNKVGKAALVGIYAIGDMSKTYKCNNCGAKF